MRIARRALTMLALLVASGGLYAAGARAATVPLSEVEIADLMFMREEEKLARDTYLTLYETWKATVFTSISSSEQLHMDAMLKLLKRYKLPDPAAGNEVGTFTNAELQALYTQLVGQGGGSLPAALKVGGLIEEKDMIDIKAAIVRSVHADVDAVYDNLLCGSRNHLRAFARNIESLTGEEYVPVYPASDPVEIRQILTSPMERCG